MPLDFVTPTQRLAAAMAKAVKRQPGLLKPLAEIVLACDRAWIAIDDLFASKPDMPRAEAKRLNSVIDDLCVFSANIREAVPGLPPSEVDAGREDKDCPP